MQLSIKTLVDSVGYSPGMCCPYPHICLYYNPLWFCNSITGTNADVVTKVTVQRHMHDRFTKYVFDYTTIYEPYCGKICLQAHMNCACPDKTAQSAPFHVILLSLQL